MPVQGAVLHLAQRAAPRAKAWGRSPPPGARAPGALSHISSRSSSFAGGAGRVGRRAAATAVSARHWRESAATTARHCTRVSINTVRGAGCQSRPQSTLCRTRPPTPHPTPDPCQFCGVGPGPARHGAARSTGKTPNPPRVLRLLRAMAGCRSRMAAARSRERAWLGLGLGLGLGSE
jgi:hypothetical protein